MHSGLTPSSASPVVADAASPGSYLTVSGAMPETAAPEPRASAAQPSALAPLAAPSPLQPYYYAQAPLPAPSDVHSAAPPLVPGEHARLGERAPQTRPVAWQPPPSVAAPGSAQSSPAGKTRLVSPAIHALGPTATATPARREAQPVALPARPRSPSPGGSTIDYADIEQKQAELRGAVEYRIAHLESSLSAREEEITSLRGQLRRMEEDYQFNYNLIGERDAALEEASAQLQRLYRELSRVSSESALMEKKLRAAEAEATSLRQAALDAEAARNSRMKQLERDFVEREKQLLGRLEASEAAMRTERDELHERYMALTREVEKSRESLLGQHSLLTEDSAHRQQQEKQRLEEELHALRSAQQGLESGKRALEAELAASQARVVALEGEKALLTARVAESTEDSGRRSDAAEDALREQARRLSALELEKTQLHQQVTDLQARLQRDTTAHAKAERRYTTQLNDLRSSFNEATQALAAATQQHDEARRKLEGDLRARGDALGRCEAQLAEAQETVRKQEEQLTQSRVARERLAQDVSRLTEDVQRWKEEEDRTADKAHTAAMAYEARVHELERAVRDAKDELDRQTRRSHETQERQQNEVARLTRELHASEAARRALEDQYHLSHDQNAQAVLVQGLRAEKEALQARVLSLEQTNGEIQAQITNFTMELQNDPLVRSARESQQRLLVTQQELLASKEETQRLQGALKAKEEEATRYQMAIMRHEFMLEEEDDGAHALAPRSRTYGTPSSTRVWRQQQQEQREAFEELRASCASLQRKLRKEKRRRRRYQRRAHSDSSERVGSSSGSSEDNSEEGVEGVDDAHSRKGVGLSTSRGRRSRRHHSSTTPLARETDTHTDGTPSKETSQRLQEAEVWRRKCLQLEQHLRVLLKERDELQSDLSRANDAVRAAEEEKRSLIGINSHLKSQLRDAYRTAYETQARTSTATTAPVASTGPGGPASGPHDGTVSPEVYAAVLSLLERQQQQRMAAQAGRETSVASAVDAVAANFEPHADRLSSPSVVPSGLNRSPQRSPHTTTGAVAASASDSHIGEARLSALEEEIRHVKAQIQATQQRHSGSAIRVRQARDAAAGPSLDDGSVVVRRGGAAVRHYGHA